MEVYFLKGIIHKTKTVGLKPNLYKKINVVLMITVPKFKCISLPYQNTEMLYLMKKVNCSAFE